MKTKQSHLTAARTQAKAGRKGTLKTATARSLVFQAPLAPVPQYAIQGYVPLAPSTPLLTAVDPFKNGLTPSNALKPPRPFWYSVDKDGLTIIGLRTETTGALMVGGPPIHVVENEVVGRVLWPDAIPIAQPDGELPTDPTVAEDHAKFAWRNEVGGAWEPTGIVVSYPTDEALASNSETPATFVYVVMKHSGYEWQSTPTAELPAGRDPNLRDKIVPQPDLTKDGSLLVQVDVSQPDYPADLFPTGPPIGAGLLGHNAGQPAFDPASDSVYVGNMPSTSLPTTPAVPNDLTSFVSVATLAPGELPAPGEVPAPVTVTVLCGPEHPDVPILAGVPQAWACIAEGGEGPFQWTFTNLPPWLTAHIDPITNQGDGILYGTPTVGTWTFQAHVDDYATTPPGTGDATITLIVTSDPSTEYEYGELEWEVGVPAAVAIEGTPKAAGDPCALEPTTSAGSLVPAWVDVQQIPGRTINNTSLGGPVENTIGCVIMGTPPISGEHYEFHMPNLQFTWPTQNLPIVISGQVFGPYMFDPLPKDVGLSGLAWHQINKIHDPSTEADLLNRELFGVEPYTGQLYRILAPYAGLEAEGTVVPPPALEGELDEVSPFGDPLTVALSAARPDIAAALTGNLKVRFGDLVVEANPNPNIFVSANGIGDPTGVDPTVIPIGGPAGSTIPVGAMLKVTGTRDSEDPAIVTVSTTSAANLPGLQSFYLGLDSDLTPAANDQGEIGQIDHGILWASGNSSGYVGIVNTGLGKYVQGLEVPSATSLGGVSVNFNTGFPYVAGKDLQNVILFAPGVPTPKAPEFISANATSFTFGVNGFFLVAALGSTNPTLTTSSTLPGGLTLTDNGDGTATLAGKPDTAGTYPITFTATNGVGSTTQNFTLTVKAALPFGWLDLARDTKDLDNILLQGATLQVVGWAADPDSNPGAPVSQVEVLIDGIAIGNATLGLARPDVATKYNRSDYATSGWSLTYNTGTLALGTHTVTAVAHDSTGLSATLLGTKSITINANNPPFGWLDLARDASDRDSTILQGGTLQAFGWACDPDYNPGAPVSKVEVLIDGTPIGNATLGLVRTDVATRYNRVDYTNSGWSITYNIGTLAAGTHSVTAIAYDSLGLSATLLGTKSITVAANNLPPFGRIDIVRDQKDGDSTLLQGGTLQVFGWAADPDSNPGAPVSQVAVLIDGTPIGNATLGLVRTDVATRYNRADYTNSGWSLTYNIGTLAVGTHTVTAVAYDSLGGSATLLGTKSITVTPGP